MPKFQFTEEDLLGPPDVPDCVAIEPAHQCEGEICGLRPELMLPSKEYAEFVARYGDHQAEDHSHLVESRARPGARRYVYAVRKIR